MMVYVDMYIAIWHHPDTHDDDDDVPMINIMIINHNNNDHTHTYTYVPVVPHKAVAEVSKIGNL